MAYDRYERGENWRGRPGSRRDRDEEFSSRRGGYRDDRGFFERAGDEISSWFRDDDDRRREWRSEPARGEGRHSGPSGRWDDRDDDRGYRPITGDYGRMGEDRYRSDRWDEGRVRRDRQPDVSDPHYSQWRRHKMDELDRDYDEYRRERQSRFESDFSSWRERRQSKRQILGQVREHMEVVGKDGEHVGTVDRVAGDRIILTRSDPMAGGVHHSLSCTAIDRIEDDRLVLEMDGDSARERWRDENRERALFEREDQGEAGPHMLNRSFSGTYR